MFSNRFNDFKMAIAVSRCILFKRSLTMPIAKYEDLYANRHFFLEKVSAREIWWMIRLDTCTTSHHTIVTLGT